MLEEPPANTLFFLVSHARGRLLPTIRSRCRRLDFGKLNYDVMTSLLSRSLPNENAAPLIERAFRDVHTAAQHIVVSPARYIPAGRVLMGLDPGTTMF